MSSPNASVNAQEKLENLAQEILGISYKDVETQARRVLRKCLELTETAEQLGAQYLKAQERADDAELAEQRERGGGSAKEFWDKWVTTATPNEKVWAPEATK